MYVIYSILRIYKTNPGYNIIIYMDKSLIVNTLLLIVIVIICILICIIIPFAFFKLEAT